MVLNAANFNTSYNFIVVGFSNVQKPKNNTVMFVAKKLFKYLKNLNYAEECLVFIEKGADISDMLREKHCFIETDNPALDYVNAITPFYNEYLNSLRSKRYVMTSGQFTMGENVNIGENVYIEPGCFIDHGVKIGDNCVILSGAVIRSNVQIGNNCIIKEKAVIGSYGFTFAKDNDKRNVRIPSLGGVIILSDVEIGSFSTICSGTAYATFIDNNVKIDDHVHIGHDATIGKSTSIAAGAIVSGYAQVGDYVYIGVGATIKNRVCVGNKAVIGLSARVYKHVKEMQTVMNEPAVTLDQLAQREALINRMKSK